MFGYDKINLKLIRSQQSDLHRCYKIRKINKLILNVMKCSLNYFGQSKYWWIVLIVGILMVISGFCYFLWPAIGYAVSSQIFGWLLVLAGIVQLCVSSYKDRPRGWGWWLAGGVIDLFIGFMLVRSVILSELVFPYFISIVFLFWGINAIFSAVDRRTTKYWWVYLINGILMLIIGFFFLEAGYVQDMLMTSWLTSLAFIYWGFSIAMLSYEMKPRVE